MKGAVEDEIKESAEISVINSELDSKEVKVAPFYVLVTFLTNIFCPWRSWRMSHTVQRVRVLHVYYTQLVQSCPSDIRRKIVRLVWNKITFGAMVDSFHQNSDSNLGGKYKEEILKRLDKMVDPPLLEASQKKRGSRRV